MLRRWRGRRRRRHRSGRRGRLSRPGNRRCPLRRCRGRGGHSSPFYLLHKSGGYCAPGDHTRSAAIFSAAQSQERRRPYNQQQYAHGNHRQEPGWTGCFGHDAPILDDGDRDIITGAAAIGNLNQLFSGYLRWQPGNHFFQVLPICHIGQTIGAQQDLVPLLQSNLRSVNLNSSLSTSLPTHQRTIILIILQPDVIACQKVRLSITHEIGTAIPHMGEIKITLVHHSRHNCGTHFGPGGHTF